MNKNQLIKTTNKWKIAIFSFGFHRFLWQLLNLLMLTNDRMVFFYCKFIQKTIL